MFNLLIFKECAIQRTLLILVNARDLYLSTLNIRPAVIAIVFSALLSACSTLPQQPAMPMSAATLALYAQHLSALQTIAQFHVKGRIGVQTKQEGFSGGIDWQHAATKDTIALYSPLGGQVASVERTPEKVTLIDAKGNSMSAKDAETLTQSALGWQLPLAGLADWVIGRPYGSCANDTQAGCSANSHSTTSNLLEKTLVFTLDAQGKVRTLDQDGWHIEYQEYVQFNKTWLPSKLYLTSQNVNIKLIVQHIILD